MGARGRNVVRVDPAYIISEWLDPYELAWAAGFYDGEGCTFNFTARARVFMGMTQGGGYAGRLVIDRFHAAVGGLGHYYVTRRSDNRKTVHRWQCATQADVYHALNRIWPWPCPGPGVRPPAYDRPHGRGQPGRHGRGGRGGRGRGPPVGLLGESARRREA